MREQRPKRLIGIAIALLALIIVVSAVPEVLHRISRRLPNIRDAYAKWDTGNLIIDYMDHHDGQWPHAWSDLRESFARLSTTDPSEPRRLRGGMPLDELERRIGVDWNADPSVLARATSNRETEPFHVIWSLDGSTTTWEGAEPNQMVLDYLRQRLAGGPSTRRR